MTDHEGTWRAADRPNRFEALLEAAPDAILLVDAEGRIELVNEKTEELFGWARDDLVGRPVEDLIPDRYRDDHVDHRADYVEDPEKRPMGVGLDLHGLHKDGTEFPVEISLSPLREDDGTHVIAIVRDMTARERIREELRAYAEKLEESNKELQDFAYVVSHDLQEPIRMVRSYVQLIEERYGDKLDEQGHEFMQFAVDGADRMQRLIRGLLEYSRVQTHGSDPEPIDAGEVLDQALDDLQVAIKEAGAEVTRDEMPTVEADPEQLRRVFENLIGNAIKFRGEESPQIHVGAQPEDGLWRFSVRDNGIGIDPQHQDRIFTIFQRLHGRDDHEGEGLGLSICKRIVERHGGEIGVESTPGEGSTFHFTFPAASEREEQDQRPDGDRQ